uniref:Uncharacterized protein n=1 Tax=Trichuris muris TaxID=70415 RepID=A0A5S6QHZ7_TRIMR
MPEASYNQSSLCAGALVLTVLVTFVILGWCDGMAGKWETFRIAVDMWLCPLPGLLAFAQSDACEQPPASLLLLSMGVVVSIVGISADSDLFMMISSAVGSALLLLLLYGVWAGITVRYVLWVIMLSTVTVLEMHTRLRDVSYGHDSRLTDLSPVLMLFILTNMLMYLMGWLVVAD